MISAFFEKGLELKNILILPYDGDSRFITKVILCFENEQNISLNVIDETDEIDIIINDIFELSEYIDATIVFPWLKKCIGRLVPFCWVMTNHKNYTDAIQFEFTRNGEVGDAIVQFKVMASDIYIYKVDLQEP